MAPRGPLALPTRGAARAEAEAAALRLGMEMDVEQAGGDDRKPVPPPDLIRLFFLDFPGYDKDAIVSRIKFWPCHLSDQPPPPAPLWVGTAKGLKVRLL
jgi:hypothetical protein